MDIYSIIKSLHIIVVITWFAAIFYLPRLFVYHAAAEDQISKDRFHIMERKLYRGIMTPSMILTLVFGTWLLFINPFWLQMGWMHVKLVLVFLLVIYHLICGWHVKQFKLDKNTKSHTYFRYFNEIPVFMLIGIVFLVVGKSF
jgi:protoporphyrinogen IX oxidase